MDVFECIDTSRDLESCEWATGMKVIRQSPEKS
jgi:hypothetical protein